jgi:hypothetical protein
MRNFEKTIYPVTPYCEYFATSYLIDKNKIYTPSNQTSTALIKSAT